MYKNLTNLRFATFLVLAALDLSIEGVANLSEACVVRNRTAARSSGKRISFSFETLNHVIKVCLKTLNSSLGCCLVLFNIVLLGVRPRFRLFRQVPLRAKNLETGRSKARSSITSPLYATTWRLLDTSPPISLPQWGRNTIVRIVLGERTRGPFCANVFPNNSRYVSCRWSEADKRRLVAAGRLIVGLPFLSSLRNLDFWLMLTHASGEAPSLLDPFFE